MLNQLQEWESRRAPEGIVDTCAGAAADDAAGGVGTPGCCNLAARADVAAGEVWPLDSGHLEAC